MADTEAAHAGDNSGNSDLLPELKDAAGTSASSSQTSGISESFGEAADSPSDAPRARKRRWPKRVAIAVIAVAVVACAAFGIYVSDYYHAGDTATQMMEDLEAAGDLSQTDAAIAVGDSDAQTGIVLYPGAKVEATAYVPLAAELAERGYYCVIAKMPFNLAFFGINAADGLMDAAPEVDSWWIAGHSLGGAMAAQYASSNPDELEGVLLLAAYAATDFSQSGLSVEILYGSNDGVLNRDALEENAANLPADAQTFVIEGGNHAGFGDYGPQDGDGATDIGAPRQWQETASLMKSEIEAA